jgi:transcriptional regulator with XRE-family HTH domain
MSEEYLVMSIKSPKSDPKFIRSYDRGMLRSSFVSLFWSIIMERKKTGAFTLQGLAKLLGKNKGEVSRWFKSDPNWTVNTIASLANALDVDITIQAIDRRTKAIFTPAGLQTSATVEYVQPQAMPLTAAKPRSMRPIIRNLPEGATVEAAANAA